jgi:hypothetical protein
MIGGQSGLGERLLGLFHRGVPDERRIMGLAPDAVVNSGDLDVADPVFVDAVGRLKRRFSTSRTYERKPSTEPEGGSDGGRRQDAPARHVQHWRSPKTELTCQAGSNDFTTQKTVHRRRLFPAAETNLKKDVWPNPGGALAHAVM